MTDTHHPWWVQRDFLNLEEDVMAEIPNLPHVMDLTVEVSSPGCHAFGASMANLLARCINLRRLRVDIVDAVIKRSKLVRMQKMSSSLC
jgi:hypothetical protein